MIWFLFIVISSQICACIMHIKKKNIANVLYVKKNKLTLSNLYPTLVTSILHNDNKLIIHIANTNTHMKKNTRLSNSLHNHVNLSQNISSANKLVLIHFPLPCVLTLFWLFECVDTFLQFLHGFLKPFSMMLIKTKLFLIFNF